LSKKFRNCSSKEQITENKLVYSSFLYSASIWEANKSAAHPTVMYINQPVILLKQSKWLAVLTEYIAMHKLCSAVSNPILTVSHPEAAREVKILEECNSSVAIHSQAHII